MFAQAIQTRTVRETRAKSHVLIFKDDLSCRGVEENFTALTPDYGERERIFLVLEFESGAIATASIAIWTFEYGVWDLVNLVCGILDLNVQALVCVICQQCMNSASDKMASYRSDTRPSK